MLRVRQQSRSHGIAGNKIQKALGVSAAYWSQVTHFRGVLTEEKLRALLDLLEFEPDEQRELLSLREMAKQRGWWNEFSAIFDDEQMRFYGLEAGAQRIRSVDVCVVPGLLQTEDYVAALVSSIVSTGRPIEAKQRVRARLLRQRLLDGPDPLQLSVIIGQAALMQQVGGREVQRQQLRHLIEQVERHPENLDLRVIPFDAQGSIASLNAATFHLLDFESPRLPTMAWMETAIYGELTDNARDVDALDYVYNQLWGAALERDESLKLIDEVSNRTD
ncbi:putative DNA-binding protein [Nocardia nova SH22a]|uniref:Putative DNA-binding protein n=2 Tax=Nocardia nova TaxID=37330 RepID=W5TNV9_9NOCA|nr:putative DNA-binding protein [Nocardia nova SH22a]